MSDRHAAENYESVSWVGTFSGRARPPSFTPWASRRSDAQPVANDDLEGAAVADPAAIHADAFAQGFEQGRRTVELELAAERAAIARFAEELETLRPEPTGVLAILLAETVERLVRDIVGAVEIDPALLIDRARQAAALIGEEVEPGRLLVHPDDVALLETARIPVQVAGDASLQRGTIVLECASGWVEDGPAVRLDRLRAELAKMGAEA